MKMITRLLCVSIGLVVAVSLYAVAFAHNHDEATRELQPANVEIQGNDRSETRRIQPSLQDSYYQPADLKW